MEMNGSGIQEGGGEEEDQKTGCRPKLGGGTWRDFDRLAPGLRGAGTTWIIGVWLALRICLSSGGTAPCKWKRGIL